MATTTAEVLIGACRLGIKISDEAVPDKYHFSVKEHYILHGQLRGELDSRME